MVEAQSLSSNRVRPVFRDREELSAANSLSLSIQEALDQSEFLIVACSPSARESHWVNQEIRHFKSKRDEDRVLAVIVDGGSTSRVFPDALLFGVTENGALNQDDRKEPLAADFRNSGDGPESATLKLIASIVGVRFDDLAKREQIQRNRRLRNIAFATSLGMLGTLSLAGYAWQQRGVAQEQQALAVEQQMAAEREARRSKRVVQFLTETFKVSDPATENPDTISARQILDRGLERLDGELATEPEIASTLLATIGDVYAGLGLFPTAEDVLSRSVELDSSPSIDTAANLTRLAQIKFRLAKRDEIEPLLQRADAVLSTTRDQDLVLARSALVRANVALESSNFEESIRHASEAVRIFNNDPNRNFQDRAEAYATLSNAHRASGNFSEALAALETTIEAFRAEHGEKHSRTAAQIQRRATLRIEMGQPELAQQDIEDALAILTNILGESHPTLATAYFTKGRIEYEQRLVTAAESFRLSLEMIERHLGSVHGFRLVVLLFGAAAEARNGASDAAYAMMDEADRILPLIYPADHPQTGFVVTQRGVVAGELGDTEKAIKLCKSGIERLISLPKASAKMVNTARQDCGDWLDTKSG